MSWLLPRLSLALLSLAFGAGLGFVVGQRIHAPILTTLFGASVAVSLVALMQALPGYRLLAWAQGATSAPAPSLGGLWGEVAYRFERMLRQAERDLAAEKNRLVQFLSAVDASPNGLVLIDSSDQIEWISSTASDHLGLDPRRDLGQRITNLVRAPAFVRYLHEGRFDEPVKISRPSGEGFLSLNARRYGEEGQKVVLTQDVTERERAETMRRDFVANVSHEIRTPLTVLSGFIESMTHLQLTEVERRRVLGLMSQQTERMQALVSDLLTLAKLEGSPRPAMDHWTSVARILAHVESDGRSLSAGRHELSFPNLKDGSVQSTQIAGSETELVSALANLVSNAVRYTPAGGCIQVKWEVLSDGTGEFSVSDTGIGIDREHIPRLTERFYRVDVSRARETGGTGLGLSIVKHIIQRHGAELRVHSELGRGSCFILVFPSARIRLHVAEDADQSSDSSGAALAPSELHAAK